MVSRNCWLEKIIPTVSFSTELHQSGRPGPADVLAGRVGGG
jgi:hypothetical protein